MALTESMIRRIVGEEVAHMLREGAEAEDDCDLSEAKRKKGKSVVKKAGKKASAGSVAIFKKAAAKKKGGEQKKKRAGFDAVKKSAEKWADDPEAVAQATTMVATGKPVVAKGEKRKLDEALSIRDSSGGAYIGHGVVLSSRDVRSFERLDERAKRLDESWGKVLTWFAVTVLPTEMGLRIVISLLKVISKIFSFPGKVAKVGWDLWDKAIGHVEEKLGVKIPIDGEQMWEIIRYFVPSEILHMVADEAIEVLEEMGPDEWKDLTKQKAKEQSL